MVEMNLKVKILNIFMTTLLPWHQVEQTILSEERWLSNVFDFGPYSGKDSAPIPPGLSHDKMLRQIAIAIVDGSVKAREINSALELGLWSDEHTYVEQIDEGEERHGGNWHRTMMNVVKKHFINEGFEVINEPFLSMGRADLGVYKSGYHDLFVEIGTTSLFKTWFNMKTMSKTILLFIPTTSYAIEFVMSGDTAHENFQTR